MSRRARQRSPAVEAKRAAAWSGPINFWDRPADERAALTSAAAERGGVDNFFDLPPDERAQAYEDRDDR